MHRDPWSVQLELEASEAVHHHVIEEVIGRLRRSPAGRSTEVSQVEGLVVVNMQIDHEDPIEAGREALGHVQRHMPGHGPLYRLTVWRWTV